MLRTRPQLPSPHQAAYEHVVDNRWACRLIDLVLYSRAALPWGPKAYQARTGSSAPGASDLDLRRGGTGPFTPIRLMVGGVMSCRRDGFHQRYTTAPLAGILGRRVVQVI
jgi:hypothetical protein